MLKPSGIALLALCALLAACDAPPPSQPSAPLDERIARIEQGILPTFTIRGEPTQTPPLAERMEQLNVPGISVAVINEGVLERT